MRVHEEPGKRDIALQRTLPRRPAAARGARDRGPESKNPLLSVRDLDNQRWQQHHQSMLMTVTLDPDVAQRIEQEVRRTGKPAQAVVNEALRTRLGLKGKAGAQVPFQVAAHDFGFAAELDLDKMNQLVDDLEATAAARKIRK